MSDQAMRIVSPGACSQSHSIEAEFHIRNQIHKIYFRNNDEAVLSGNLESFVAGAILPCMKAGGGQLVAEGEISQKFITALSVIQDIYCSWDDTLHRTEVVNVIPVARTSSNEDRVGTFFSGGVDSFYTLIKHQDEITDLIFIDMRLTDSVLREKTSKIIRDVASAFGKNVIEIETNIRELFKPYVKWGPLGHGAALAAIGHLLYPAFSRIYIPATHTYTDLFPWGSHPVLDHLWSSDSLEFIHDGCEATRVEKVSLLSKYEIALQSLRVCWRNPNGSYNCGRCEKCIRTMINLEVNDALGRCTTFDEELDLKRVSKMIVDHEYTRVFIRENLNALEKKQGNEELIKALRKALNTPPWLHKSEKWFRKMMKCLAIRST